MYSTAVRSTCGKGELSRIVRNFRTASEAADGPGVFVREVVVIGRDSLYVVGVATTFVQVCRQCTWKSANA